jgi:CheY-like chemotaxis protein
MKRILIVEDNPADSYLLEEAFREASMEISRNVVCDGVEAMAFLLKQGHYQDAPRPDAIILDLNMPKKDGREVIREIKEHSDLCNIPIVVFSGSSAKDEMAQLRSEGVQHTLVKPSDLDAYFAQVRTFLQILSAC